MGLYIDQRAFDTLDSQKTGAYYSLVGDLNGTGYMRQDFDDTFHPVSNMANKYDAGSVAATAPATGTAWATPIYIPAGFTVRNISFVAGTTAGATLTHCWFALCNSSLKIIASSADDTTATWTASTIRTYALAKVNGATATAYTVPTTTVGNRPVLHYAMIMVAGTTIPTLASKVAPLYSVTTTPASGVTDQTGKTVALATDASVTVAIATPNVNVPWVGLS